MNEATAALIGSIVTAFIGLVGIGLTQWVSWRTARLRAKEAGESKGPGVAQPELPLIAVPGTSLTSLAVIRLDIEAMKLSVAKGQAEILLVLQAIAAQIQALQSSLNANDRN